VLVADHDLATAGGRAGVKRMLGYLPQDLGRYPDLTAAEFLDYVALLKGIDDRAARRRRGAELLEVVALSDVAKRRLKGFSGGMKRRVGIAQALLNDPRLLIVDEPAAGLEPGERIRFRTLLAQPGRGLPRAAQRPERPAMTGGDVVRYPRSSRTTDSAVSRCASCSARRATKDALMSR
jgi:ABC-type multidrug transport system ATPase subunit